MKKHWTLLCLDLNLSPSPLFVPNVLTDFVKIPVMCFSNLSSELRVTPSNFFSTLEMSATSLIFNFSVFLLFSKIKDFSVLAFMCLFSKHLNNLKVNVCNSDITVHIFSPQVYGAVSST